MLKGVFPEAIVLKTLMITSTNFVSLLKKVVVSGGCTHETVQLSDAYLNMIKNQVPGCLLMIKDWLRQTIAARHDAYIGDSKPNKPTYEQPVSLGRTPKMLQHLLECSG